MTHSYQIKQNIFVLFKICLQCLPVKFILYFILSIDSINNYVNLLNTSSFFQKNSSMNFFFFFFWSTFWVFWFSVYVHNNHDFVEKHVTLIESRLSIDRTTQQQIISCWINFIIAFKIPSIDIDIAICCWRLL